MWEQRERLTELENNGSYAYVLDEWYVYNDLRDREGYCVGHGTKKRGSELTESSTPEVADCVVSLRLSHGLMMPCASSGTVRFRP